MIRHATNFLRLLITLLAGFSILTAEVSCTTPTLSTSTETFFNAAGAPSMKLYADASGQLYGYSGELLTSILTPRGHSIGLTYSNNGAKDLIGAAFPEITSGPFTIGPMTEAYGYDRAGRINFIGDNSGGRALTFENGRLANTTYTTGPFKGYAILTGRDTSGRHTDTQLNRDGNPIHTFAIVSIDTSDQILDLASGGITATPQRDSAGNITGYEWSDGTNTVTQTWTRGPGGRIEFAGSNVPGAPTFDYLLNPNQPLESFDLKGRRLKCETSGGIWTYEYGIGGQLTKAEHGSLGTFNYHFDAIGRRTVEAIPDNNHPNLTNLLNRTTAWTHDQTKKLTIKAHPDARVWFNGVEIPNFTGQHIHPLAPPGAGEWFEWQTLAILEGAGEGAGNPPANPLASPDAKAEQSGAVWIPPANEILHYDNSGNRLDNAQWDYGWDAKNQLTRARTKNHTTAPQAYDITFTYDSEGRRVKKHVLELQNGAVAYEKIITFIWDDWNLLYERHQAPNGMLLFDRKYVWGPDMEDGAAGGAGGLLLIRETRGQTTHDYYPIFDGTGHVTGLTDSAGNLVAEYWYGPFGELIESKGPQANANPFRYATKYFDAETGLYSFGHRYYDPVTGQWLNREPLGEDESLNLYAYCHNDPVNRVDVLGLRSKWVTDPHDPVTELADGRKLVNLVWYQHRTFRGGYLDYSKRSNREYGSNYWDHYLWDKQPNGTWCATPENQFWADASRIAEERYHLSTHAKIGNVLGTVYSAALFAPMAVAAAPTLITKGIAMAPSLYTSGYVKLTGASVALQSSPWGVPIVGGGFTTGAMLLDGEDPGTAIASGGMQAITGRVMAGPVNLSAFRPANWGMLNPAHYRFPVGQTNLPLFGAPLPKYVGPASINTTHSNTTVFQGLEVRAVRNLSHIDDSTLRAMARIGFAPRTINGDSIILHHHRQNPSGFIVEMPSINHAQGRFNPKLHPFGNTKGSGLTPEERTAFNIWRVDYWKWRAQMEINQRRLEQ